MRLVQLSLRLLPHNTIEWLQLWHISSMTRPGEWRLRRTWCDATMCNATMTVCNAYQQHARLCGTNALNLINQIGFLGCSDWSFRCIVTKYTFRILKIIFILCIENNPSSIPRNSARHTMVTVTQLSTQLSNVHLNTCEGNTSLQVHHSWTLQNGRVA